MKYNIIGIDPSLISTALTIYNGSDIKILNYLREKDAVIKSGFSKWYKYAENFVNYKYISFREFDSYSQGELTKLVDYDIITDKIIEDILTNINPDIDTIIGIEGYSYGSAVGDLIDLVTFSTLLRKKLYDKVSTKIVVIAPSSLKLESAKLTYKPITKVINEGKKNERVEYTYRNNIGISGGSFTKSDIFLSIIENEKYNDIWSNHCHQVKEEILNRASIPKPYEDICDSYIIYQYLINSLRE